MTTENALFPESVGKSRALMPEGFRYEEDIISEADEAALAKSLATLDLKPFEFHGHLGNRRVTSFGLRYDYARRNVEAADAFLCILRGHIHLRHCCTGMDPLRVLDPEDEIVR